MDCGQSHPVVLIPVRPQYAEPLMSGQKRVEFRKKSFRARPSHVVVYASSPVQRVVGYFRVAEVDVAAVSDLWYRYSEVGGIVEEDFAAYYAGHDEGVAFTVAEVLALDEPVALEEIGLGSRPPQSFAYLDAEVLGLLDAMQPAHL